VKVVAFSGSARKDGNTAISVSAVFRELKKEGEWIKTEMIQLAGRKNHGCIACGKYFKKKDGLCAVKGDIVNECIEKMVDADRILLALPTYFTDVLTKMKALIDRSGYVGKANDDMFRRKVRATVVAVLRGGAIHAFDAMNHFFIISRMMVPGEMNEDEEGIVTMKMLGANMTWVMKKLNE
jgi:multimeric flavodoxin WrbA